MRAAYSLSSSTTSSNTKHLNHKLADYDRITCATGLLWCQYIVRVYVLCVIVNLQLVFLLYIENIWAWYSFPRKRMATKMPRKKIDDIMKLREMLEICDLLNIVYDEEGSNLRDLKVKAKKKIQEQSSSGTTVNLYYFLISVFLTF